MKYYKQNNISIREYQVIVLKVYYITLCLEKEKTSFNNNNNVPFEGKMSK